MFFEVFVNVQDDVVEVDVVDFEDVDGGEFGEFGDEVGVDFFGDGV